jgi:LmbE family N-acetylglucosaminyl deacetylase
LASTSLDFKPGDRVLVFAPHPDDETIACGNLIQCVLAAGATLQVVFATDGDNNPWPQRWLERRWRIGAADRVRWGARRRGEALAALAALGVDGRCAHFLGWPDQGLTERLMRDDADIRVLGGLLAAFAPTRVVLPALGDRHPDHSALCVMLELALVASGIACERLGYVLHGDTPAGTGLAPAPDAARQSQKRQALAAYATQTSLSHARLERLVARPEHFVTAAPAASRPRLDTGGVLHLRVPAPTPLARVRAHTLLALLAGPLATQRVALPLPVPRALRQGVELDVPGVARFRLRQEAANDSLEIVIRARSGSLAYGYLKLERAWPRLVLFDAAGWRELGDCAVGGTTIDAHGNQPLAVRGTT